MFINKTIILVLSFFVFSFACKRSKTQYELKSKSDLIVVNENNLIKNSDEFIDSIQYVILETNPTSLIGTIGRIEILSDTILIFDRQTNRLLKFDLYGKFIGEFGKKGKGPGEFARISAFSTDRQKNEILMFDVTQQRMLRYSLSGNLISTSLDNINMWPHSFSFQNNEYIIYQNKTPNFKNESIYYDLIVVKDEKLNNKYFQFTEDYKPWFGPEYPFYFLHDTLYFIRHFEAEIYSITEDNIKLKYKIDFSGNNLPVIYTKDEKTYDLHAKNYSFLFMNFLESNKHIYFDYTKKGKLYRSVFDKTNLNLRTIKNTDSGAGLQYFLFKPQYVYKDYFVAYVESSFIVQIRERQKIEDPILKELSNKINLSDNPILIFYKLKNF